MLQMWEARMTTHIHHWRIAEPEGETSLGICECGAQREFRNYLPVIGKLEYWLLQRLMA